MALKKGFYFTLDTFFAITLIILGVVLLSQVEFPRQDIGELRGVSNDVINIMNAIKMKDLNDPYAQSLFENGLILNEDNTVLEQIGELWARNMTDEAVNLARNVTNLLVPSYLGFGIYVNDNPIYERGLTIEQRNIISIRRMVSGYEKNRPVQGTTSQAYLQSIKNKKTSSFIYFGGFVGQGIVSRFTDEIPSDANITRMTAELNPGKNFYLYINNIQCQGIYNASGLYMQKSVWDITSCNASINKGSRNNVTIEFIGDVNDAFIGGGFIQIEYLTEQLYTNESTTTTYNFPHIDGIVNLYSSFYIPGNLENLTLHLHYFANDTNETNNTFYVTFGDVTIYNETNLIGETSVTLTDVNLTPLLTYASYNSDTIPLRVGFENVSFGYIYEGNADVSLITDLSGSMDWRMDIDSVAGAQRNCDNVNLGDADTARLSVAKCLDKEFVVDIINISGNKIGLVSYDDVTHNFETISPTTNITLLNQTIGIANPENGYEASGSTCICCGINSAKNSLIQSTTRTVIFSSGSTWNYTSDYLFDIPPTDLSNRTWKDQGYSYENTWNTGTAILGSTNSYIYAPLVVTEIGSNLSGIKRYADLWEYTTDLTGPPNDFTSGTLNFTANTFGHLAGDDGWDWDTQNSVGIFGYDDDIDYNGIVGGRLSLDTNEGGAGNQCSNNDCSGSYGIQINVTPELYNVITLGGNVRISFYYEWDGNDNPFEGTDEVWIKSYWQSPTTGIHYLGSELSSVDSDSILEIAYADNPDTDFSGVFSQDITSFIEGAGTYYLALGGKLQASANDEWGAFYFDDIQIEFEEPDLDALYVNFWEDEGDVNGAPADFSSGTLNSTANTYGISGNNDGWDWDTLNGAGPFDYDDNVDYNAIVAEQLNFDFDYGGSGNTCSNGDCSGAYGIKVNITDEMYALMSANGFATLSFDYMWDDAPGNNFETTDQVWIKARWTSPTTGSHMLGNQLDQGHQGEDTDFEIATTDNPDNDFSGTYSTDLSSMIEGSGLYYLELGAKLYSSGGIEYGTIMFDNVQIKVTNKTNRYYFRKNINIPDVSQVGKGIFNFLSDDSITVYLNGQQIFKDTTENTASYWNTRGLTVEQNRFQTGNNVISVELVNVAGAAKFDMDLAILNNSRDLAMMVMSDGAANVQCAEQSTGSSTQDAIQAACDAKEDYGITVYSVGYSDAADDSTLSGIAACGEGLFEQSSNLAALSEFYKDVASSIISVSRHSQTIEVSGAITDSILYSDSYIKANYTPITTPAQFGEIEIQQLIPLDNCSANVTIPSSLRVVDAKVTSYSDEHWTDLVTINSNIAFNLSTYNTDYSTLGDPFVVHLPSTYVNSGLNQITISTGDDSVTATGCSLNNSFIYTGALDASVSYSAVLEEAKGCTWTVEFDIGGTGTFKVPADYAGPKLCSFTSTNISYYMNDSIDSAVYSLLNQLDFDNNNMSNIYVGASDFIINALYIPKVPYLWGPAIVEVRLWH